MLLPSPRPRLARLCALAGLVILAGCAPQPDLVVYCALDQVYAEPLIERFERETGLDVEARFDIEATKTVGLVNAIRSEHNRVRCDVFWNNEVAHSVALAAEGRLAAYDSPSAAEIPETFRDPERRWTGFAARARVLIVNTDLLDPQLVTSMYDLLDPRWAGQVGMARPLTGTTLTHMAALFHALGEPAAEAYLQGLKAANAADELDFTSGNATLMRQVREGNLAFGWTDTDDFNVALEEGAPVAAVYPDQIGRDGKPALGTLLIPNTIALIDGAPHPDAARRFIDWALRPEIEAELAQGRSAQIPVRSSVERPAHVRDGDELVYMQVDFVRLGADFVRLQNRLKEMFLD
jgi:iron(III) transport system substrate-binding protein